jgi:antitoxin component YwqK of YwqJK toxin-antitoxin module
MGLPYNLLKKSAMRVFILRLLCWILPTFFTLFCVPAFGQTQSVMFLNKHGEKIKGTDSAAYIRTLTREGKRDTLYQLKEQYMTGEIYRTGTAFFNRGKLTLTGLITSYQKNGKKMCEEQYRQGVLNDTSRYYYKNGNIRSEVFASDGAENLQDIHKLPSRLVTYYDSLGNQLVKEGNGHIKTSNCCGDSSEGDYKDGYQEGLWQGTFFRGKYRYEESYSHGKLIEGTSTDSLGRKAPYSEIEEQPKYPGGMSALYRFIGMNYKYPLLAPQPPIRGVIILYFVVDAQGKLVDIKVVEDLGFGTGREGMRVLSKSATWTPGKLRGVPVNVSHSLPIRLNL